MTEALALLLDFAAEHPFKTTLWLALVCATIACGPLRLLTVRHVHHHHRE